MAKQFWLMKSEPDQFGIADLARVKIEPWTGVRSYFARAHMRAMSVGDAVLFHHSNATPPGVAGTARVVRTRVVDETQFDPESKYYDPKATREAPIWDCVEVEYVATLPYFVPLDRIRAESALAEMLLLRRGMRLSVQPVTEAEYEAIVAIGQIAPPAQVERPVRRKPGSPKPTRSVPPVGPRRARAAGPRQAAPANSAKAAKLGRAKPAKPAAPAKPARPGASAKPAGGARAANGRRGRSAARATS